MEHTWMIFAGVAGGALVLNEIARRWGRLSPRRLELIQQRTLSEDEKELARPFMGRVVLPLMESLGKGIGQLAPVSVQAQVREDLVRAGWQSRFRPVDFLMLQWILMLTLPLMVWFLMGAAQVPVKVRLVESLVFLLLGWRTPMLILRKAVAQRSQRIEKDLPYCLDLLVVSSEAGLGFDGAVQRVVQRTSGPLSEEFDRVLQDMRMGKTRQEAWLGLKERTNVPELNSFVNAVIQASQLGLSLSNVLRVQSDLVRQRRRERAEVQARKMTVKILLPLIFFIFPALFIVILGPVAIIILDTFKQVGV
jgi:tight adherence protein C